MDEVWFVAALWALVGVAAILIAMWLGGSLRNEYLRIRKELGRAPKTFRLIRGGKLSVAARPGVSEYRTGLIAVRRGPSHARAFSRPMD